MAANGAPNWLIQLAGRWRTDQFLKYIRLSTEAFQQSITAISSCTMFNSDDIRMWNAGVDLIHANKFLNETGVMTLISPPHMFLHTDFEGWVLVGWTPTLPVQITIV
jgi:hypothetical protein